MRAAFIHNFQTNRLGLAILVGFGLVIIFDSIAGATYGPRTVIGANYQQWSNTTSPDGIADGNCNSHLMCSILFQRPPQGKHLVIRHVTCRVTLTTGALRAGELRIRKGQNFPVSSSTYLQPVNISGNDWIANNPVFQLVNFNERPVITFSASNSAGWAMACSVSGHLEEA